MNKKIKYVISVVFTIVIFSVIFLQINLSQFIEVISKINLFVLVISLLLIIPQVYLNAYRWIIIIKNYKQITLTQSLKATLISQSLNVVTPSHFGELGKAYVLKDKKFNIKIGAAAVLFEKAIDLLSILLICVIGLFIIKPEINFIMLIIGSLIFVILMFILMFLLNLKQDGFIQKIIKFIVPFKKFKEMLISMLDYFDTIKKDINKIFFIFIITFLKWMISFYQSYLFFLALGLKIDFMIILAIVPLGIIVGMIPITIAGIGTRDAAFIYLFKDIVPSHVMIAFGMIFSLRYIIPALVGLPLFWRKIK